MQFVVANRIYVANDWRETFEERFRKRAGEIDKQPGFVRMEVMKPVKEGTPYIVQTHWADKASFDNWVGSPDFKHSHANPMPPEAFSQKGGLEMHEVMISADLAGQVV
ncbi:MAG: antibiotic biosynthesis monooxygenase family protein [Pontibacterium sp.]